MTNVVAIIQARTGSSRLPRKVLLPLGEKEVLAHVYSRLQECSFISEIVVATSTDPSDNDIESLCKRDNINIFRGNLLDVLDRYFQSASFYNADIIVRITADCPLIDPSIVDIVIKDFLSNPCDLLTLTDDAPDGLDVAIFSMSSLTLAWEQAELPSEREHVGPYIESNPHIFKIRRNSFFREWNVGHIRITLDEPSDYTLLKIIFERLKPKDRTYKNIIQMIAEDCKLQNINSNILRNEGYIKSLEQDSAYLAKKNKL